MSAPIPLPVQRALVRLGENISLARRRRNMTQRMLAERIGASVSTVRRMEEGYPGTALHHLARTLQVFGELSRLEQLLDAAQDPVGLALMEERVPLRVRPARSTDDSGAF